MSGLMLSEACEPAFARHETFHPRFGWLHKAVANAGDGAAFSAPDATVTLGVGKNMVNAIRYWGLAFKVLQLEPNPQRPRLPLVLPTEFGTALLGEDGWDPYLEDPASLWLLHWKLLAKPCTAPVWWIAFNDFSPLQFQETQLTSHIVQLAAAAGWPTVVESSIKKDVDCLLRTYTVRRHGRQALDDILDCPFRELGLIEAAAGGEGHSWRFVLGHKPSLPDAVIAYAALNFAAMASAGKSISLARLTHEPGSPGAAFRLTQTNLFDALTRFSAQTPDVSLVEPSGQRQLLYRSDPAVLATDALHHHYASTHDREAVPA